MTQQELVEQNIRLVLGDMQLQLILARAEVQALKEQIEANERDKSEPLPGETPAAKANGKPPKEAVQ
jgi:hypothetical protein